MMAQRLRPFSIGSIIQLPGFKHVSNLATTSQDFDRCAILVSQEEHHSVGTSDILFQVD